MKGWEILKEIQEGKAYGKKWRRQGDTSGFYIDCTGIGNYEDRKDHQFHLSICSLLQEDWSEYQPFKLGDVVYVRVGNSCEWMKKIFLAYDKASLFPYKVVSEEFLCGCDWFLECISEAEYNRLNNKEN